MEWTANRVIAACIFLLAVGIGTIMYFTPTVEKNIVCYSGYRYTVDLNGVMWVVQVNGVLQRCLPGDTDVSK